MAIALTRQAIYYEAGATPLPFAALIDSGDHQQFSITAKPWSQAAGYEAVIAPYGVINGGAITPAVAATNNTVDVATLLAHMPGATGANPTTGQLTVAAAAAITATRSVVGGTPYQTTSITINSSGAVIAVAGIVGATQSETRGSAGGPPFIPVDSLEVGQVRLSSIVAAPVLATEIYQVPNLHREVWNAHTVDYIGGSIKFSEPLPLIHTGGLPKKVYVRVATPIFAEISGAKDWVPAKESYSSQSESFYDGVIGSASSSLGTAGFAVSLNDGVTDALLALEGNNVLFKFKPDKNGSAYQITQGIFSVAQTFAVKSMAMGTVTIAAQQPTRNFSS